MGIKIIITEAQLNSLINEVRYIDTTDKNKKYWQDRWNNQRPINNDEVIRVYHGFSKLEEAIYVAKKGLSGKQRAYRRFSYESGMNPVGLFISVNFDVAADFNYGYPHVVMEFSAKVNDLDTPVWNNSDSYFGQGSNPMPFYDKSHRDAQRDEYEQSASNSNYEYIRNSDNKALADKLFNNSEHQALYYGDLNPNMIKRFWIQDSYNSHYYSLSRVDFIKKYGNIEYSKTLEEREGNKLYLPNEEFNGWKDYIQRSFKSLINNCKDKEELNELHQEMEEVYNYLIDNVNDIIKNKNYNNGLNHTFLTTMFPKQQIKALGKEWYQAFVNKFS